LDSFDLLISRIIFEKINKNIILMYFRAKKYFEKTTITTLKKQNIAYDLLHSNT
jgi:hypothetical protein